MKLSEGIDYHIKDIGKTKELSAMIFTGLVAGVVDLTRRGYDINLSTATTIGNMYVVRTVPKVKKPAKKKTVKK